MIPDAGLAVRDVNNLNRANAGCRRHDGRVAIPRFFPFDGDRLIGVCDGRQTHDTVTFFIEQTKPCEEVNLFGYTFDHPAIADAPTNAAR